MRTLSVVFLAAVLFATLYPLTGWRLRAPGPFAFVAAGLPRWWTGFDVLVNVLAYLVLAFTLTRAWFGRLRTGVATLAGIVVCSALSFGLEALQSYLPGRVPSLLDWLANTAGAAIGAALGAELNHVARQSGPEAPLARQRWYEQGSPTGWVLLMVWLAVQLAPQRLLFGTGQLRPGLEGLVRALSLGDVLARIEAWLEVSAAQGVLIEAASVMCAVCVIGMLVFDLVRESGPRLALLALIAVVALALRSVATPFVYGARAPLAWLTPGAQGGLVLGVVMIYGFGTLSPRARARSALALVAAGWVLVNIAPSDGYFESTSGGLPRGHLVNLHALLAFASMSWPVAALVYFWRRSGRERVPPL